LHCTHILIRPKYSTPQKSQKALKNWSHPPFAPTSHLPTTAVTDKLQQQVCKLDPTSSSSSSKRISSGAQYATLRKYFSHPSLVIYSFATPPIKLKLGQQIGGGITNNKPPRPIIMMGQSETLSSN